MPGPDRLTGKTGRGAALCVSTSREAADAGAEILERGGNAFEAAAAAGFMEAVVSPANCGIAQGRRLVGIDANAVAPARATSGMFPVIPTRDPNDYRLPDSRHKQGPLSVAAPGVLGGLILLVETWGRLGRRAVMAPAIARAREGVRLTPGQALTWLTMKARADDEPRPSRAGLPAIVPMPELAASLEAIADEGSVVFYSGRIGRAIADHVAKLAGILTRDDMAAYSARVVEPVTVDVRGHRLATPPPASGGLSSLQITALYDRLARGGKTGGSGSAEALSASIEIAKVVWEERLTRMADAPAMTDGPAALLSEAHLDALEARVVTGLARPEPGRIVAPDPLRGTVHLAAADREGNVVSWTQTHGGGYGSGVMVPRTGIVLGHGMCRFEPRPGWPNSIAPGKRPLHNMSPVIAVRDGRCLLAVGCSGGRTIVNNSAAVLIGVIILGLDPEAAVAAPRVQCETIEPAVVERAAGAATIEALRKRGHSVREAARDAGNAQLIARDRDAWLGVAEPRLATAAVAPA
jgi:gamma-glutamyltranspeptidase/glutathione hydrolase